MTSKIDSFFNDNGPLARILPGYRRRGQQVRLAHAVDATLRSGGALLGDGPTGTGKSMAYLVPAALSGTKTVVSTATKALQHQLVDKDLPTLVSAFEEAGLEPPTYAILKGRGEFLCDRRTDEYLEEQGVFIPEELEAIDEWRRDTPTGDKESLPIAPPAYWAEIAADSDDCHRKSCPHSESCFYFRQKERGMDAKILVVNHALLLANLASGGAVFDMKGRHLIVDEAHRLEEYISEAFGARVSHRRIKYVCGAIRRKAADLDEYLTEVAEEAGDFFSELGSSWRALGDPSLAPPSYDNLIKSLRAVRNRVRSNPREEVNKLANMADKLITDLESFYSPLQGTHAYAVLDQRKGHPVLQSWLVEPAEVFPEEILEREDGAATVLTSATLAVGRGPSSFDYQRRRLGFDTVPYLNVREHLGAEMFDYERNSLVYLESELPAPTPANTEAFLDGAVGRAAELVWISDGRALILLATWKAVQRFKEDFRDLVAPYPVRFQGEDSTSNLTAWLKRTPSAVLVGTRSLWEGIDIAGDALSLVVIDKVPFPPPNDPVIERLCEKAGSRWFMEISLPKAMLAIRQGLGRLIRRDNDRGVMAILDSRVTNSRWGPTIRRALPEGARTTRSVADVAEFFGSDDPSKYAA